MSNLELLYAYINASEKIKLAIQKLLEESESQIESLD